MRRLAVVTSAILLAGCYYGNWPEKYDAFFKLDGTAREKAVLDYKPSDQLELHIYSTCHLHPPDEELGEIIGMHNDAGLIQSVRGRLNQHVWHRGVDSCHTYALVLVVSSLSSRGMKLDSILVQSLRSRVQRMEPSNRKAESQLLLAKIR